MADIVSAYLINDQENILRVSMTVARGVPTPHQIDFAAQCAARSLGGTWRTMTKEEIAAYKLNQS